jgi:FG-GAP repeat protein
MNSMRAPRPLSRHTAHIVCGVFASLIGLAAACGDDDDHTDVCLGPGCVNYQGIAGKNSLTASGLGGFGGALDAGPDASSPAGGAGAGGTDAGSSEPEPCAVAFVSPLSADAGAIRVGGADDVDGEACGPSFTARVLVQTNASTLTLFVNDNPLGAVAVSGGAAAIDATLGNRGDTGNTLRVEATLSDGRQCSAELPTSVFVDCPGPSCSIDEPRANRDGFLNQSQDQDAESEGLQTDIHVSTELLHVDQPVRLQLDGNFDAIPGATVQADGAQGLATFPAVTLDEGTRTVRAECKDEFGVLTLSPPIEWNVDLSACSLELDSIASDINPITPAQDLDQSPGNGLDVLVRGSIEGDDCESIQIGQCQSQLTEISLRGLLGDDGGFIVPIKLGAQTASLSLCARVVDAAGNASSPDVTRDVDVRVDSPSLAIESPLGSTRYNSTGSGGALADGNPASGSCEVDVAVDCTDVNVGVELLADGTPIATQPCVAQSGLPDPFLGRASFSGVSLPSKDDGAQTALSARQSVTGLNPGVSGSVQVQADCNAPTCSFSAPDPGQTFLNASSDSSTDPGFQVTFDIATGAADAGRSVRLSFDNDPDNDMTAPAVASGGGALATFANVTLSEAAHVVQAFCTDAAGNATSTAPETWTLDQTACTTSVLVASGHDPVVPNDDLDVAPNLQVSVSGLATGASCSAVRVGLCDSIAGAFTDLDSGGTFTLQTTLPSATAAGLSVCAEIQDEAGNVTSQSALVNVRVDAPTVAFVSPTEGTHFNSTSGCTQSVVVSCSEDGSLVELFADGLSQGTQTCSGSLATFNVALLSKDDGATTALTARETAQGVSSAPASVNVQADCNAPALSITQPVCNTQLALTGDDVNGSAPGLQINVDVANGGVPSVTLTVTAGASTDIPGSSSTSTTSFSAVDLGGAGSVALRACATDPQGNQGCTPSCPLTITGEPSISITSPRPPAVLTIDDDCDTDPDAGGLQISVQGTSDATDGSPVNVTVGTGSTATTTLSGGVFSACVPAPDGEDQVLTATVTDSDTGLSKSTSVIVSTNTSPPPPIGAPTVAVTGRRQGTLTLSWSSTLDASDDPLVAYLLRCSRTDITSEAIWDAATAFPVSVTPSSVAGTPQTQAVTGFRTGVERFCMVRGRDAYGQLSALTGPSPTVATVANPFLTLDYNSVLPTTVTGTRVSLAAVGDINGDNENDFIYGTQGGGALIYFGGPDLDPTPDVTLTPPAQGSNAEFGANVSGLGDINGDGRPDFAITARFLTQPGASFGGSVFVFFGRASTNPWPSSIAVAASPGCGADICFHSSETLAALGSSVTATNFDGTGGPDLVIGAQNRTGTDNVTQRVGRVYVILGGTQLDVPSGTVFALPGASLNGFTIDPPSTASRNFGVNVAGVGLGSDTRGDLVISSVGRNLGGETVNGEAFSVLGRAYTAGSGLQAVSAGTAFAVGTPNGFGNPMRAVGDVNGDGFGDVWISTNFDLNGVDPVYLGRSAGFSGVSLLGFTNDVVDNEWAAYMATGFHTELGRLGDLDGNGFDDVLVGSVFANGAPGTADLFYSDATTGSRSRSLADVRVASSGNGQMTPGFVGDLDGDGFRDFVILDSGPSLAAPHLTLFY